MSETPWPDHLLSLDEWAALPEDNTRHFELADGVLIVSPRPSSNHQWALYELGYQLRDQLPADLRALPDVEVVVAAEGLATVRVPDLVVVSRQVAMTNPARYRPGDVLLAVEIVSPGSRKTDHVTKMYEYSQASIPSYWILDIERPTKLTAYQLVAGKYKSIAEGSGKLELREPAPVTIDVANLLPQRT